MKTFSSCRPHFSLGLFTFLSVVPENLTTEQRWWGEWDHGSCSSMSTAVLGLTEAKDARFPFVWECRRHTLYISQAIFSSYLKGACRWWTGAKWLPSPHGQTRFPRILLCLWEWLMYVTGRHSPGSEHLADRYVRPGRALIITQNWSCFAKSFGHTILLNHWGNLGVIMLRLPFYKSRN